MLWKKIPKKQTSTYNVKICQNYFIIRKSFNHVIRYVIANSNLKKKGGDKRRKMAQPVVLVEASALKFHDLHDLEVVYELSKKINGTKKLYVDLKCYSIDENKGFLNFDFVQKKIVRMYMASMEGSLETDITVIPPILGRKEQPSVYLHPDTLITLDETENDSLTTLTPSFFEGFPSLLDHKSPYTENREQSQYQVSKLVCFGGTFDRLHAGHKLMIAAAVFTSAAVVAGVTDDSMLKSKGNREMIQSYEQRSANLASYFHAMNPEMPFSSERLMDPLGPAVAIPEVDAIVVSQETLSGAKKINEVRAEKGFGPLKVHLIMYVPPPKSLAALAKDVKLSSSTLRKKEL